jgi:hypothetical protein
MIIKLRIGKEERKRKELLNSNSKEEYKKISPLFY